MSGPDANRTFAIVAGGGTVGHVAPGVAIARALVDRGHPSETIHFVGSARGVEATRVPDAGFEVTLLPGRGIQRRLTLDNVAAVAGLVKAFAQSLLLVRRLRPSVVVAMGGYASVPCALAAVIWRVPLVVAEQNAVPGLANRLLGRFAKACAVSFPGTDLPRAVHTGNPVRAEVLAVHRSTDRDVARAKLGVPDDRTLITAFGGSLGARRVNEAVLAASAGAWRERSDLAVRHIIGDRDWDRHAAELPQPSPDGLAYEAIRYEEDMPTVLAASDLVVCRSGASSVAEIAAVGVGSVLVPLPGAPGDHQTANAAELQAAGAAILVADAALDGPTLADRVAGIVGVDGRTEEMAAAAASCGRRDAADAVADLVMRHARAESDRGPR
ncbi:MAG: undecaprenyldiphospho-muramoylpentapeptide beta-N-acetylglucosaminyltransferase [Actinomycetota bacterium]|nr:undecaprenyldiphospho-muramoylpentapeptide beta-N-acetylglucosaminyltransferase [Actinomycetota bacterium]